MKMAKRPGQEYGNDKKSLARVGISQEDPGKSIEMKIFTESSRWADSDYKL